MTNSEIEVVEAADGTPCVSESDAEVVTAKTRWSIRRWAAEGRVRKFKRGADVFYALPDLAPQPVDQPKRRKLRRVK